MSKHCCDDKKHKKSKLGGIDPFFIGTIVVILALLGGVFYFGTMAGQATPVTTDSQVELSLGETRHDWGTIDIAAGKVTKEFEIKNTSSSTLKLYDVKTSCMCTTAQLSTSSNKSKVYGMHEKTAYVFEVKPGETATLFIEFDPAFHGPSGTGAISRTVTMSTNDPSNPQLAFNLTANVIKK